LYSADEVFTGGVLGTSVKRSRKEGEDAPGLSLDMPDNFVKAAATAIRVSIDSLSESS
jgi:hypothetical protein